MKTRALAIVADGADIRRIAEDVIRTFGPRAYSYLCDQAVLARGVGDEDSAIVWWDIALAVIEIRNARGAGRVATVPADPRRDQTRRPAHRARVRAPS